MNTPPTDARVVAVRSDAPTLAYDDDAFLPKQATVDHWMAVAKHLLESGVLPETLDTPGKVLAVWCYARELNVPAIRALGKLYVVDGKVGMYAELMVELARRGGVWFKILEHTDEICRVVAKRKNPDGTVEDAEDQFTYAEAQNAGLAKKFNWQKYRRDMLKWRALARVLRFLAPDLIHGGYLPDELPALQATMTDMPEGSPEYLAHGRQGSQPIDTVASPSVVSSQRRDTGTSRIGSGKEPERGARPVAEAVEGGGTGATPDPGEQDQGAPVSGDPPSAADEAAGGASVQPGAAEPQDDPVQGEDELGPKGRHTLNGWKAFVSGVAVTAVPPVGSRAATWWVSGWNEAQERARLAIARRAEAAVLTDQEGEQELRQGAAAWLDHEKPIESCPYEEGSQRRLFWLTGYRAALKSSETQPEADPPGEPEELDREAWEAEAKHLAEEMGIGDLDQICNRVYNGELGELWDADLEDLVKNLRGTFSGANDGTWMDKRKPKPKS